MGKLSPEAKQPQTREATASRRWMICRPVRWLGGCSPCQEVPPGLGECHYQPKNRSRHELWAAMTLSSSGGVGCKVKTEKASPRLCLGSAGRWAVLLAAERHEPRSVGKGCSRPMLADFSQQRLSKSKSKGADEAN